MRLMPKCPLISWAFWMTACRSAGAGTMRVEPLVITRWMTSAPSADITRRYPLTRRATRRHCAGVTVDWCRRRLWRLNRTGSSSWMSTWPGSLALKLISLLPLNTACGCSVSSETATEVARSTIGVATSSSPPWLYRMAQISCAMSDPSRLYGAVGVGGGACLWVMLTRSEAVAGVVMPLVMEQVRRSPLMAAWSMQLPVMMWRWCCVTPGAAVEPVG